MNLPTQTNCPMALAIRLAPPAGSIGGAGVRRARAFTLIEMLVVLGIIGMLAAMTLPSITNSRKGNISETVTRQLMDDLSNARLKAMSARTKVYVVFAPDLNFFGALTAAQTNMLFTNAAANSVVGGQLTTYALYSPRIVGEQPGQNTPRYLSDWRSLPSGSFIPSSLFRNPGVFHNVGLSPQTNAIPVDDVAGAISLFLPYIAFDEQGRLFGRNTNIALSIIEGSILHLQDSTGQTNIVVPTDAVETSQLIPSGGIVAGIEYLVAGTPGSQINYPPVGALAAGRTFVGQSGFPSYGTVGSPRVVQHYGVRIDWITGRPKAIKPELP
ncbi:MAG: type II secretion system protein [Verrucomicrobia bacterium]|nr:type II secretion system protein [Verrucomicrobiota bacterium]